MKKAIYLSLLCLSVHVSAQDTTYFAQDFEDRAILRTWADHNDKMINTENQALPHVKFNHIQGGLPERATLDITYASGVIANRSLKVFIPNMEGDPESPHYGRSISYYLGGQVVRGDAAVDTTWKKGQPIRDSFVPDNDEMYLRYHIKLDPSWVFRPAGAKAHVVKIPGLAGTHKSGSGGMWPQEPDSLGWSARMLAGRGPEYTNDEWSPISYVYHLDQKCGNTDHSCGTGDHFPSGSDGVEWDLLPHHQMGQWYRIEQRIKMNDTDPIIESNGLIEVWINGKKENALCNYELRYTTADTIGINRAWADIHYGGKYSSPADNTLFLDNFHVSTGPTPWSGELVGDSEWSGTIHVDGDVIVREVIVDGVAEAEEVTLTVTEGTEVRFAAGSDGTGGGSDASRSELIVADGGTLVVSGVAGGEVAFGSASATPSNDDWHGIRVESGGTADLSNVTFRHGTNCLESDGTLTMSNATFSDCGMISGESAVEFAEIGTDPVETYTASSLIGDSVTWSLVEDENEDYDNDDLSIDPEGRLSFDSAPDYEEPKGGDPDDPVNVYRVRVRAVGSLDNVSADYGVTVTVTDVDEDGTVSFGTDSPKMGVCMTVRLEDPDGPVTDEVWTLDRLAGGELVDGTPVLQAPEDLGELARAFLPTLPDVGRTVRATVRYRDAHSMSGDEAKSEAFAATLPVEWGEPLALRVLSELGELEFGVSLSLVPCGGLGPVSPVPFEDVVLERCTGPSSDETCLEFTGDDLVKLVTGGIPFGAPGERSSEARGRVSSSLTFSAPVAAVDNRLDNRKTYRFTAYLIGPEEQKSPESNEVSVLGLRSEARAGAVGLSWDVPAGLTGITGWSYRYKQEGGTWDADSWQTTGTGATVTAVEVGSLTNGVSYEFQVRALRGTKTGPESFVVPATPERPDTRGRVEWSTTQPRVGQELTPTLIDPDNPALAEARWRWRRQRWSRSDDGDSLSAPAPGSRSGESKLGVIARTRQYRPQVSDLNQWLWVEVTYTDDFGGQRVSATASRAVGPGPPCAPANLKAAPGDGQVTLTWEAGCNNGGTIDRYQYRRPEAVKWVRVPGDGSARRQQVEGLTNGEAHTFEVRAGNPQEWGPAAQATATPAAAGRTVSFAAAAYQASEGGEAATVTVRLSPSPSASEALSIPITVNPPSGDFTVAGLTDGALSFSSGAERQTFTITANQDDDWDDEEVTLGFGTPLPEGVSAGTPATATVSLVDDDDAPGTVSIDPATAQVGTELSATLSDADEVAAVTGWQWHRRASDQAAWTAISGATAAAYTPVSADAGQYLQATVSYTDGHGPDKGAASAAIGPVAESPEPPDLTVSFDRESYSATEGGTASVTVSVSPETDRALKIPISVTPDSETEEDDYTVTWPGVADTLWFESGATAQSFAIQANADPDSDDETVSLGFGTPLPAGVSAGTPSRATLTLAERPTGALVIVGTQDTTFAERREGVVAPYRALSADGQAVAPVSWSLGGADADTLTIDDAGRLRFEEPPDYENPADANRDTVYEVTVEANADGQPAADAALPVSVRVTNVDDPGEVTLISSSPRVGTPLTAVLTDQDRGIRVDGWHWQHRDRDTDAWEPPLPAGRYPGLTSYTPQPGDAGKRLRATVGYADALGPDKRAQSDSTARVIHAQVFFGAESYQAAEGGAAATVTVRMEPAADRQLGIPIEATGEAGTESDDYSLGGLGSGNTLTFSNGDAARTFTITAKPDGDGDDGRVRLGFGSLPWQVTAGSPAGAAVTLVEPATNSPPDPPDGPTAVLFAEDREDSVATYRLTDPNPDDVLRLQKEGPDAAHFRISGDTLYFADRPDFPDFEGTADADRNDVYEVSLRTSDGSLLSNPLTVQVTVTNVDEGPGRIEFLTGTPQVDVRVRGTLTDPDGNVDVRSQQWQRLGSSGWEPTTTDEETRTPPSTYPGYVYYTPTEDDVGYRLRVTASYLDGESADEEDRKSAQSGETHPVVATAPPPPVRRLEILGAADTTFAEGATGLVEDYGACWTDDGSLATGVTWTLSGADAKSDTLVLSDQGVLSFLVEPDYEHPKDADGDTVWSVIVEAEDAGPPAADTTLGVSVRITNEDDPGVVSLAPPTSPQVGHQLRAQLRDPDGGVTGAVWQWQTRQPGPGGRALQRVASDTTYRPVSGDAGLLLSARVYYADAHGSGKVAAREYAELVAPRRLTVTFGRSSYEAVEGGESVAVTVSLSAAAERLVKIPITRAPESGDYTATWPGVEDTLSFSGSTTSQSFTVTATQDADRVDESVALGFGDLPERVSTGTHATATVRLVDDDGDSPGTVRLSTSSPEVGRRMTATLVDVDGSVADTSWQWQRRADASSGWVPIERSARYPIAATSRYTPMTSDVGKQLRATVGYTDAHGPNKSAQSAVTSSVRPADTPGTVRLSTSSPEVGRRMTATLVDVDGSVADTSWQWQRRADASSGWVPIERSARYPIAATSRYTPVTSDVGKQLRATVGYTDAHGPGKSAQSDATAAVKAPNRPPVIDDTGTQSVPENTRSVATFTATDPEGQAITWSVIGNVFQISSSGEVSFQNAPSYESGTTSYSLTVRATDPKGASDTETVTVNVTDVDEPPGPPSNVRVSAAGRTSVEVEWDAPNTSGRPPVTDYDVQYRASGNWRTHSFSGTGTSTTISSLTPNTAYEVQVNAANDEGTSGWAAGSGRTDCGAPTISGPTSQSIPENTTAVASYSLSDPDGGGGRWLPLGGADASAFNFSGGTLSFRSAPDYETDSRQYQVTIRARGGCSSSSSASRAVTVSVRNVGPPGKPTVTVTVPATNGHEELDVGWSTSASDAPVTGWKLQYCQTNACSSTTTLPFDAGTTSTTLENLRSGTRYSVRVKATSDEGDSPWSAIRRTYTRANTAPVISGTARQNVNENTTAVGTYTATDAEGDGITWDIYSTDSDEFSFTSSGSSLTLRFESAPDYEDPTDANTNNIYVVRIRATDDANPPANSNKLINATVQDIGPPSKMTVPTVRVPSSGTGKLEVSWSHPTSGAPVTGYTMQYCYPAFRSEEDPPEEEKDDSDAPRQAVCSETTLGRVTSKTLTGLPAYTLYTVRLKATSKEGTGPWSNSGSAITRSAAAKALAEQLALTGLDGLAALAAPNPFNPSTTIYFQVPEAGEVSLVVYSLAGQVVRKLIPGRTLKAGIHDVFWEGRDEQGRPVAAGVYFYRLRAGDRALVRKMTLLR